MPPLSERTFAHLRSEFAAVIDIYEDLIRPEMPLDWFVPHEQCRDFWSRLRRRTRLRMPELQPPQAMAHFGRWLCWGAAIRGLICGLCLAAKWLSLPLAVLSFVATAAGYFLVTRRWATEHPGIVTFGDLSQSILAHNLEVFRTRFELKPQRAEIFATMRVILSDALGVEQNEVTWEARLIDDLGAG